MKENFLQRMLWVLGAAALGPFAAALCVFLQPMKAAVSFDSATPFYLLRPPVELSDLLCASLLLAVFIGAVPVRWGDKLLRVGACALSAGLPAGNLFLLLPAFFLILCSVFELLRKTWFGRRKWGKILVWGLFFLLCLENAMAVRVAIWRGRLANHPDEISASFRGETWYSKPLDSFLLSTLLPAGCKLEDVRWITGGLPLRKWLKQIGMRQEIQADLDKDLAGSALGLFRRSSAESKAGNEEGARYWLSQIRHLEEDPGAALEWIGSLPEARADGSLKEYGVRFKDPSVFSDPLPWRKDDYGFGRFLVRFFFGMDILSRWDRRVPRL
jgi:hypothetical protein